MTKERVLIIAVKKKNQLPHHFQASVDEIESLSKTAGGTVIETVEQNRHSIHPVTYVGEGKLAEIGDLVAANDIGLVVANDELSPGQLRNINDQLGLRVIDRNRHGGGIGTRGPGETKLETHQRHIRRRSDEVKRRLKDVVQQREPYRKRRKHNQVFQVAIIGYTNAGKTTTFKQLSDEASLE